MTSKRTMCDHTQAGQVKLEEVIEMCTALVPRRVGSDISFVELPDELEPSMLLKMTKGSHLNRLYFRGVTQHKPSHASRNESRLPSKGGDWRPARPEGMALCNHTRHRCPPYNSIRNGRVY